MGVLDLDGGSELDTDANVVGLRTEDEDEGDDEIYL